MKLIPDQRSIKRRRFALGCGGALMILLALAGAALIRTGPSAACMFNSLQLSDGDGVIRTLETGGRERCYLLFVPDTLDTIQRIPLVITMHGVGLQPQGLAEMTGWNEVAAREGLIVAYPQGTGIPLRWNSAAAYGAEAADDVQFIADLVTELSATLPIDPHRVFVNGLSNGGGMAYRLVCERPEMFAAAAGVAGFYAPPPGGCRPDRPVPVIAFHGTADPLVFYDGGQIPTSFFTGLIGFSAAAPELNYPAVESWALDWAERNSCRQAPERQQLTDEVLVLRYEACQDNTQVVLYTIEGGGHAWPSQSRRGFSPTTKDIDATETIWSFFEKFPMRPEPVALLQQLDSLAPKTTGPPDD